MRVCVCACTYMYILQLFTTDFLRMQQERKREKVTFVCSMIKKEA